MVTYKHLAALAAVVPVLALGTAASASAAPRPVHFSSVGVVAAAKGPITEIKGKSAAVAVYAPTKLSVKTITGTCSATNYSFGIANLTKVSETVTEAGKTLVTIKPNYEELLCATSGSGVTKFSLKGNKKAVLKVTLS